MNNGFRSFPNYISYISEEEYTVVDSYCKLLDTVSRVTRQSIYLVDFYKGRITYISENPIILAGISPKEIKELNKNFNEKKISEEENRMIIKITAEWLKFMENIPVEEKCLYSVKYDYEINNIILNVCMSPAFLSKEGRPWLVLCNSMISTNATSGNVIISKEKTSKIWKFCFKQDKWEESNCISFSEIEKEVLRLSLQGKKEKEICREIYRSIDGLKSMKKKIFKKMEVANITEAVSYAINHGVI